MLQVVRQLDELLRGDRTRPNDLNAGRLDISAKISVLQAVTLGAIYGAFMGWFAVANAGQWKQLLAATVKVPMLFVLTLLVTFPSLYVFSALMGSKLELRSTLRLLLAAIVVNLAVGASLGPIVGFFTLSTTSYHFMVLLNVAVLGVAGLIGLGFLLRTLKALVSGAMAREVPIEPEPSTQPPPLPGEAPPAVRTETSGDAAAGSVFRVWIILYALVGVQMAWLLRPFIGNPGGPFEFFRAREGNFFQSVCECVRALAGW